MLPRFAIEAISFGIPIIATNVGGTNEIVNQTTGILIDKNFKPIQLAKIVDDFSVHNKKYSHEVIRNFWLENFHFEKNYNKFIEQLLYNF